MDEKPSILLVYSTLLTFLVLSSGSFLFFGYSIVNLLVEIASDASVITIDKGSFYFCGIGLGLGALLFDGVPKHILGKPLSEKGLGIVSKVLVLSLLLMLLLPHAIHYPVANYLDNNSYSYCPEKSSRWLHSATIVYTKEDS